MGSCVDIINQPDWQGQMLLMVDCMSWRFGACVCQHLAHVCQESHAAAGKHHLFWIQMVHMTSSGDSRCPRSEGFLLKMGADLLHRITKIIGMLCIVPPHSADCHRLLGVAAAVETIKGPTAAVHVTFHCHSRNSRRGCKHLFPASADEACRAEHSNVTGCK